jgi:hypothetical protein
MYERIKDIIRKTPLIYLIRYFRSLASHPPPSPPTPIPPSPPALPPFLGDANLVEAIHQNSIYFTFAPPGHYYSPIPALADLQANQERIFNRQKQILPGITMDDQAMLENVEHFKKFYAEFPFPNDQTKRLRYWTKNGTFSRGDGIILYSILRHLQPARIIEVGSGMSSCLMLDVDELFLKNKMQLTFIDPHPDRLLEQISSKDLKRIKLVPKKLQDVDLSIFESLEPNDIAFFDSTHVSKCDSDVNVIFFKILPVLKPGVFIHFHDVFYPFEYPEAWLLEVGAAWNEIYILRAFLEFNNCFQIAFFNDYMARFHKDRLAVTMPQFLDGLAASIWLKKTASG